MQPTKTWSNVKVRLNYLRTGLNGHRSGGSMRLGSEKPLSRGLAHQFVRHTAEAVQAPNSVHDQCSPCRKYALQQHATVVPDRDCAKPCCRSTAQCQTFCTEEWHA